MNQETISAIAARSAMVDRLWWWWRGIAVGTLICLLSTALSYAGVIGGLVTGLLSTMGAALVVGSLVGWLRVNARLNHSYEEEP